MIQQKSENDIVPEAGRKAGQTEEKKKSPKGGKVVSVNKERSLIELTEAKTDKSTENVESSATREDDPSSSSNRRGVNSKQHEKKRSSITLEKNIVVSS